MELEGQYTDTSWPSPWHNQYAYTSARIIWHLDATIVSPDVAGSAAVTLASAVFQAPDAQETNYKCEEEGVVVLLPAVVGV